MEKTYEEIERRFTSCCRKYGDRPVMVLLGFYKGQYHKFILSAFFFVVKHSPALFSSLLVANVINGIVEGGEAAKRAIVLNTLIWTVLLACNLPANWLHHRYKSQVIRRTEAGLRAALAAKLQEVSIPYYTATQSGRLQSKIMRDVEAVETLSSQLFVNLVNIIMNLVIILGITAVKNRQILMLFILMTPAAAACAVVFRSKIHRENRAFRKEMEETSAKVMEMVEMVPVARAHALEEKEVERLRGQLEETAKRGYRLDMIQAHFGAVSWCVIKAFQILCLAVSGFMAFYGMIKVGDVTFYQSSFNTVVHQFTALMNLLPLLTKGLESVTSIGELLAMDQVERYEGKEQMESLEGRYDFDQVCFSYGQREQPVLEGLSLHVGQGETVALVGESGEGKTTFLNMLVGFISPTDGKLFIDGKNAEDLDLRSYRRFISMVPQNPVLFTGTVRENILCGLEGHGDEELWEAIKAADLFSMVSALPDGLDTMIEEHGANLSGGQRQRISIARAIIRRPKVMILDEATSALDAGSEKKVLAGLKQAGAGCTTFVVAHRLSVVRGADRIILLENGKIGEEGSYQELMERKGRFYQMERLQMASIKSFWAFH